MKTGGNFKQTAGMREVELIFPDTEMIADFIVKHKVANAVVNSRDFILKAWMDDVDIIIACTSYGGQVRFMGTALKLS